MNRVCPFCGSEVPFELARPGAETIFCPGCGHELDLPVNPQPEPPLGSPPLPEPPAAEPAFAAPYDGLAAATDQLGPMEVVEPIAWEGDAGFLSRLFATVSAVLFHPSQAFRAPAAPGHRWALSFGVIVTTLASCVSLLWSYSLGELTIGRTALITVLVVMPLVSVVALYVAAGMVHFFLWAVRGAKTGFFPTFRALGYTQATAIFQLIPMVGSIVAGIWQLVALTHALAESHGITRARAFVALLLPLLLLVVLLLIGMTIAANMGISLFEMPGVGMKDI